MASIFTKIVNGEIPSYKVAESENCLAFLDVYPIARGHTLVIPKKEIDYLFDLEEPLYTELQQFTRKVALGLGEAVPCIRVGQAVVGLEVPHAHIHLIPLHGVLDIDFSRPKLSFSENEFQDLAQSISQAISL